MTKRTKARLAAAVAAVFCVGSAAIPAFGASATWDGGGANDNINTSANWTADAPPAFTGQADDVHFAGNVRLTPNINTALGIRNLFFDAGAEPFTLTGTSRITVGRRTANDTTDTVENNSAFTQTISAPFASRKLIIDAASADLVFNGSQFIIGDINGGDQPLTVQGAHDIYISTGTITSTGTTGHNVTKTGAGTLFLTSTGVSDWKGGLTISNGAVRIQSGDGLGDPTRIAGGNNWGTTLGGGTSNSGRLELTNNLSSPEPITINGRSGNAVDNVHILNVSGANTLTGEFTLGGNDPNATYNLRSDAGTLTITSNLTTPTSSATAARTLKLLGDGNGVLSGNITATSNVASFDLIKRGAGTWTLGGTNDLRGTADGTLRIEGGTLAITGSTETRHAVTVAGGTLRVSGALNSTLPVTVSSAGSVVLQNTGSLGTPRIDLAAGTALDVTAFAGGYTFSGKTVAGAGTILGTLNADGATLIAGDTGLGTMILGGLTLAGSNTMELSIGNSPATVNVVSLDGLVANGSTSLKISGSGLSTGDYTLIDYAGGLGGAGLGSFSIAQLPSRASGQLVQNASNGSIDLRITAIDKPKWTGAMGPSWDLNTQSWQEINSGLATTYLQPAIPGDEVLFDESATGTTAIEITSGVAPARITVDNTSKVYSFGGFGGISGPGALVKKGEGTLIIANYDANTYLGGTFIEAGTLQVGDSSINYGNGGSISGTVVNDGKLIFARTDDTTVANDISGAGSVEKKGAGVLTLSGNSSFAGEMLISEGTVKVGNANALGNKVGGTTIAAGATLDVYNQQLGMEVITVQGDGVGGFGALINTASGGQQNAVRKLVLAGNATLGGSTRFDVRTNTTVGETATVQGNGYNLTKVGSNTIAFVNVGEANLGDINVLSGTFSIENGTQIGAAGQVTVNSGAIFQIWSNTGAPYIVTGKPVAMNSGRVNSTSGTNVYQGQFTLNYDPAATAPDNQFEVGGVSLTLTQPLVGAGSLLKSSSGTMYIPEGSTYAGRTHIRGGILEVTVLANGGVASSIGMSDNSAGNLIIGAGTSTPPSTLRYVGDGDDTDRLLTLGTGESRIDASGTGPVRFTNSGFAGFVNNASGANDNRTLRLDGTNTDDNTLAVSIPEEGDSAYTVALQKYGAGTWVLSGNNSYDGQTTVEQGVLVVASDTALGSTVGITRVLDQTPGTSHPLPAALHLASDTGLNIAENFETTGGGSGGGDPEGAGVIRSVKGNNVLAGNITLVGGGGHSTFTADAGSKLTLSGVITNTTQYDRTLWMGGAGEGEISGVVQNNTALTMALGKTGTGTWTISGANTYTGSTTVTRGTLKIASAGSIAASPWINVQAEGTLDVAAFPSGWSLATGQELYGTGRVAGTLRADAGSMVTPATVGTVGTLTMDGLTLAGGAINFDLGPIAASDRIVVTGALDVSLHSAINLNDIGIEVGTYALIDFGSFSGSIADVSLSPDIIGGLPVKLEIDAANTTLNLVVTSGAELNQWIVAGGGNASDPVNWRNGEVPNAVGAVARFWNQGSGSVTVDAPLTVGTLTIDNPVAYAIAGAQPITLQATNGNKASLKVSSGTHEISAPLVLASDTLVNVQAADSLLAILGVVDGTRSLTKQGLGTLTLSADNTYAGNTTVIGGTLNVTSLKDGGVASSIGQSASAAGSLVLSGGTLRYTGAGDSINRLFTLGPTSLAGNIQSSGTGPIAFTNAGTMGLTGSGDRTLTLGGTNTGDNVLAAAIGEPVDTVTSIVKTDAGTWSLAGNSSYSGTTRISGGTLIAASENALGDVAGATIVNGGTLGVRGAVTIAEPVDIAGSAGTAGLLNLADDNSWAGQIAMIEGAAANYRIQSAAGRLAITGSIVNNTAASVTGARTLYLEGAGDGEVSGAIGGGSGTQVVNVVKDGPGTWTLSGSNTFSGTITVTTGALRITNPAALSDTSAGVVIPGGTAAGQLQLDGGIYVSGEPIGLAGRTQTNAAPHLVNVGGDNTWSPTISLTHDSSYYSIQSNAGKLTLTNGITNDGANNTVRTVTLGGAADGEVVGAIGNGATTPLGVINLVKEGAGTWTLSAYSTYSGTTTVKAGTLALGAYAGLSTSAIQTDAGATFDVSATNQWTPTWILPANTTLSGSGTFKGGYSVQSGNGITAGAVGAPGTITFAGPLDVANASINFDLGPSEAPGANDLIQVNGNLKLDGVSAVNLGMLGGVPAAGSYPLFKYTGSLTGNTGNLMVSNPGDYRQTFAFDTTSTPNQVSLIVSGSNATLVWVGDGTTNAWDVRGAQNWTNNGAPDTFWTYDNVVFGDGGSAAVAVSLTMAVTPAVATVEGSQNYTFAGTGKLTGTASIVKVGTGTLTINNANDFTGTVTISDGVLKAGSTTALGSIAGATYINGTGTLDTNQKNLGLEPVFVEGAGLNGQGAIINSSATAQNQTLQNVTLTGDATFGGAGRWDVRTPGGSPQAQFNGNGFSLTKVGANQVSVVDVGETSLGDIVVKEGTLLFQGNSTLGNPEATAMLSPGTTLILYVTTSAHAKKIVSDGATIYANAGSTTPPVTVQALTGPVTLLTNTGFRAHSSQTLVLSNVISGPGGLEKWGDGVVELADSNTYEGRTLLTTAVLRVNKLVNGGLPSSIGQSSADPANLQFDSARLEYVGAGDDTDRLFTLGLGAARIDASGTGPLRFTNTGPAAFMDDPAVADKSRSLRLDGTNTDLNTMSVAIGEEADPGYVVNIAKYGSGTWVLAGSNSHDGGTTIEEGVLIVTNSAAFGSAVGDTYVHDDHWTTIDPPSHIAASLILSHPTGMTTAEPFRITGSGDGGSARPGPGVLRNGSGDNVLTGQITLVGTSNPSSTVKVEAGTLTLAGTIRNEAGYNKTLILGGPGDGFITGNIVNNGANWMAIEKIDAGTWTLSGANTHTGATTVTQGKLVLKEAQNLRAFTVAAGAEAEMAPGSSLSVTALNLAGDEVAGWGGLVDLTTGLLSVANADDAVLARITSQILQARNGGTWDGAAGITSSADMLDGLMNVGVILEGTTVRAGYVRTGDLNVDGVIDGEDYLLADSGFMAGRTRWQDGNVDYGLVVDGDDFFAIDQGFLSQSAPLAPQGVAAVPEPGTLGLLAIGVAGLLARRRRA